MKKIRTIIDYILLPKHQFINCHRANESRTESYRLSGDSERGYELHATRKYLGGRSDLTMSRTYYKPLNESEAVQVIFGGWKAANRIFHARLAEIRAAKA